MMRPICVYAMALLALIGVTACRDAAQAPPVVQGSSPVDSADQFLIGMQTVLNNAGVKRANILADTAYLYDNSARIEMLGVHATFYTSTGVPDGVLTARRATYDTRADSMDAYGDVKVVSTDGQTLTTPFLRYNKALNQISSDSAFKLTAPDRTVSGIGFDSDPGMNALRIHQNVSGSAGRVAIPKR